MIVRPRPHLFQLFFILRGSVIQRIFPQVLAVFALSVLIVWGHRADPGRVPTVNGAPFALLGIALSVFLGFRNNSCYDRWWEARKEWGHLVSACRNLARQTQVLTSRVAREKLIRLAAAFAHALLHHLRAGLPVSDLHAKLPEDVRAKLVAARSMPDAILLDMGGILADRRAHGEISDIQFGILDGTLSQMSAVLSACDRIRSTPVPFGYTLLLHRTAYIFCALLPFGFADVLGWGTPFATAVVAYTFFGLDALGDELEEPFGELPNDLPLHALATAIEINLREALGDTDLPPMPQPVEYILM